LFATVTGFIAQNQFLSIAYFIAWQFRLKLFLFCVTRKAQETQEMLVQDVIMSQVRLASRLTLRQSESRPARLQDQQIKIKVRLD
jgi:hypothetical protein